MNNLELKAVRQSLGLTVAEAAEMTNVTKRAFQYWEAGKRAVPDDVDLIFSTKAAHYSMILERMISDVEAATIHPKGDEVAPTKKPILPFYNDFKCFAEATHCNSIAHWRGYQAVIGQLVLLGKVTKLDDGAVIPQSFWIWRWLGMEFENS